MFLSSSNLKAHVAASMKGRYALNTIALTQRGTLSSDGHALLLVPYPEIVPADAPMIPGVNPTLPPDKPVLLDTNDAAKAAAMLGKRKRASNPFCELVQIEVRGEELVLGATDLAASQTMTVKQAEGEFPDVGRVIPDYADAKAVTLELDQLLRSLKALRAATKSDTVTLRMIDDQQAIGVSCDDGVAMLVMPVGVEKPEEHCPDQLAKLRQDASVSESGPKTVTAPEQEPDDEEPVEDGYEPTEAEMEAAYADMAKQPA